MAKIDLLLKDLENLNRDELWVVWEFLQQKIKSFILNPAQSVEKEETKTLNFNDFSFGRTREILKGKNLNLSDAVIEERRV
ncbi:hypothetical protein V9L05_12410 [Bernardetia sp. Wsw4-3y2]|uniref:hypothetical protein n=1 Tax=Bernardetia sp. Wsw4-3y2 TaxID=3127471 RepID=UPI0030CB3B8C